MTSKQVEHPKSYAEAVAFLLAHSGDSIFVLGPVVLAPDDSPYFSVGMAQPGGAFYLCCVEGDEDDRVAIALGFVDKPVVICETDDELQMARTCETLWPCTRTLQIRRDIEAERKTQSGEIA